MKRFYSQSRIMLMTFALGLAIVFMSNGSLQFSDEILVNLPKTESENVLIVFPLCRSERPLGGGSGPDWTPPPGWVPLGEKENEGCKEINQRNLRLRFK